MIIIEPKTMRANDEDAEGERQGVVGLARCTRDIEKEDQVDAHLRHGEDGQLDGNAGRIFDAGKYGLPNAQVFQIQFRLQDVEDGVVGFGGISDDDRVQGQPL
jgi:hypothetical protein